MTERADVPKEIDHILKHGDMFIGQTADKPSQPYNLFLLTTDQKRFEFVKNVTSHKGLFKLLDEVLVNPADNHTKPEKGTDKIKVWLQPQRGIIQVWNNGLSVPIKESNIPSSADATKLAYDPELIFFHLRGTTNGKSNKTTGGKFGYGAKVAGIYSDFFRIEICDGEKVYKQEGRNNLKIIMPPTIKKAKKSEKPYVCITFKPEVWRFTGEGQTFNETFMRIATGRVYDIAGTTSEKCKVWLAVGDTDKPNYALLPVKNFKDYVCMHLHPEDQKDWSRKDDMKNLSYIKEPFKDRYWEICIAKNPYPYEVQVSHVNNIHTFEGGEHVRYIENQILHLLRKKIPELQMYQLRPHLLVFINAVVVDPDFDGQSKRRLITTSKQFGDTVKLPDSILNKFKNNGLMEALTKVFSDKSLKDIKSVMGSGKNKSISDISKLYDADVAGTRKSQEASIFLVEGDSALKLALIGRKILGKDTFGAFPLKGKIARGDTILKQMAANVKKKKNKAYAEQKEKDVGAEFIKLCRVLGLVVGEKTSRSQLRYGGKIIAFTDQDVDGSHIKALLIWLLYNLWPHLLKNESNLLYSFVTPIIAVRRKRKLIKYFNTEQEFRVWWNTMTVRQRGPLSVQHLKGLASSSNDDASEYFEDFQGRLKPFCKMDQRDEEALLLAFHKDKAEEKKQWLQNYDEDDVLDWNQPSISIHDFIHKDLKHYFYSTLKRNLSSQEDGMSHVQRKVLYGSIKYFKSSSEDMKVSILGGKVSDVTNYHHGEASIQNAIIGMAQEFPGKKQNINLLYPQGQFGSELFGGGDSGAPRYIFTNLMDIVPYIFRPEDEIVLKPVEDEGVEVEYTHFSPIIPMILINGGTGVASGFKSDIPCWNPNDLIKRLKSRLKKEEEEPFPLPWYAEHGATVVPSHSSYESVGKFMELSDTEYHIIQLPLGVWVNDYKVHLNKLEQKGIVLKYKEDDDSGYIVTTAKKIVDPIKTFGLKKSITVTLNMVSEEKAFSVKSYSKPEEVFNAFYDFRLRFYEKRRLAQISRLEKLIPDLNAKIKFIQLVCEKKLDVLAKNEVCQAICTKEGITEDQFKRFMEMSIRSLNEDRRNQIIGSLQKTKDELQDWKTVTNEDRYMKELEELEEQLLPYWKERHERLEKTKRKPVISKKKKIKKRKV